MSEDVVIKVEGLWKRYGLPLGSAMRNFSRRLRGQSPVDLASDGPWALRGIDFEVKRGETLGLIGRNGAGKSTLLKVLAGVTPPTRGSVTTTGLLFPMIELNAGLHDDLTGRENVRLLAAIMGLTRDEIEAKMPDIEDFCELGEWFDKSVRKYSSGMRVRLGFAVAMNVNAEILLIDEVLAVGDISFQAKCYRYMELRRQENVTTLLVSHSIRQLLRTCDRIILLNDGQVIEVGAATEISVAYLRSTNERIANQMQSTLYAMLEDARPGTGDVRVVSVRILNASGSEVEEIHTGESVCIEIEMKAVKPTITTVTFRLFSVEQIIVAHFFTTFTEDGGFLCEKTCRLQCQIDDFNLVPGVYWIHIKLGREGAVYDIFDNATSIQVVSENEEAISSSGICYMPHHWQLIESQAER